MIIAQISDTHLTLDTPDADRRMHDFASTIADINALDPAPDVIVHTGDIVHNGRADEYARAAAIFAAALAPVYVLAGNRDDRRNLRAVFSARGYLAPGADRIDFVVEDYPVRLIALDTLSPGDNKGEFSAAQAERLIAAIDAQTTKPVAVFTHHPPFEVMVGPERLHFKSADGMSRLREALQRCDRVIAVFSGHVHRAAEGFVGPIPASVVQCIATTLRKGEYPPSMRARPVYHLHRFDPAWGFATETRIVKSEPKLSHERSTASISAASLAGG